MSDQTSDQPAVKVRLARAQESIALQKAQSESAATAIALYVHVLAGLEGIVPVDKVHGIAATITAGIYGSPD